MANTVTPIAANAVKIFNPDALYVTPFEGEVRGTTTYKLSEVIRDTTSITQDDPRSRLLIMSSVVHLS